MYSLSTAAASARCGIACVLGVPLCTAKRQTLPDGGVHGVCTVVIVLQDGMVMSGEAM